MKSALRTAVLLATVATTGVTACAPSLIMCACPPDLFPLMVCGKFLNRDGTRLAPAMNLPLRARARQVAHVPRHSVIPRPAGWGVKNISMAAITITTHCDHAPVVTVTPAGAARTLSIARGKNGGIAGLVLAQTSNITIMIRAYRGHHLIGKATIPRVIPARPPPTPPPSPSLIPVPCHRLGPQGGQGPEPLYCLPGTALPVAD